MAHVNLSTRDVNVLEKIKDPESNPAAGVITDESLPRDPHVTNSADYDKVVQQERNIIAKIQALETEFSESQSQDANETAIQGYQHCLAELDTLISKFPKYASARNNRAQITRRLYGDAMLLEITTGMPLPLIEQPDATEKKKAAVRALQDLETSISLLSPATLSTPISPQAARTLSMAYTQRAAIYLRTSKLLSDRLLDIDESRAEANWNRVEFEQAASHDLAYGGGYGNQIAKGLAVSVNPTAKLCGQIVREAMKKEYGPSFDA
ncbi:hypothetical protein MAC_02016 [Metarhizium acridum CQMa 102]|uniref:Tetratricopeptide repeat protein 36 n=1 Tax=Metarhizium acridum (strain CQMa 102) TaxID=655827 RepID=E9DWL8_METAQ|nr:uncharacterized protein MAC_02016 [Metarhizium acridum CQMa 102]EFY92068.1 hypothetical protein MAC_02016 [Metarhizium acridum CQMa 102]